MKRITGIAEIIEISYHANENKPKDSFYLLKINAYSQKDVYDVDIVYVVVSDNLKHLYGFLPYHYEELVICTDKFKKEILVQVEECRKEEILKIILPIQKKLLEQWEGKNV